MTQRSTTSGRLNALNPPTMAAAAAILLACVGCGSGSVKIEGAATFDGQPIESGSIVFEPADGKGPATGGKIADGRYSVISEEGIAPGKKIVRIIAVRKTGRQIDAGPPAGTMVDEIEKYIPPIYNRKSTLMCEIVAAANEHDFHLKSN
jgi:hypothetical protein